MADSDAPERERAAAAAALVVALLDDLTAAIGAYLTMDAFDDYGEAWEWLQRLAARWREVAEQHKLEQLGDDFLPGDAQDLLASLEGSLVLAASADEQRRAQRLGDAELVGRLIAVASQGLWDDWDELIGPAWAEVERRAGKPIERGPVERPQTPRPGRRKRAARARELVALLNTTIHETAALYCELAPDGRELNPEERERAREQLETAAVCSRTIDLEYDTIARDDHEFFRPAYALFRSLQRSLVLALSDDPARRGLAMALGEAQLRGLMVREQVVNGASWADAWEAALAEASG